MTTTAIFAELLVIGFMVLAWLALLLGAFLGLPDLVMLKGWEALITLAILALAYVLGIPADRIADSWTDRLDNDLRVTYVHPDARNYMSREMRLRIMKDGLDAALRFLDYARSRRRISRSAVVNAAAFVGWCLILLISSIWLNLHLSRKVLAVALLVSLVIGLSSFYSWCRTGRLYFEELSRAYLIHVVQAPPPLPDFPEPPTVPSFLKSRRWWFQKRQQSE